MDADAAARHWADVWESAWPTADIEAIAALYAPDAVFYSHPFRERQGPKEYVQWAFDDQTEAECRFGEPLVAGARAAVDWWGVIVSRDGSVQTVAGDAPAPADRVHDRAGDDECEGRAENREEVLLSYRPLQGTMEAAEHDGRRDEHVRTFAPAPWHPAFRTGVGGRGG
jgi:SnoaL-like domain